MISVPRRHWFRCLAVLLYGGPLFVATPFAAQAEDSAFHLGWFRDSDFHELDSKYLFGSFTRGASVGEEGERAIEPDTRASFASWRNLVGEYSSSSSVSGAAYCPVGPTFYWKIGPKRSSAHRGKRAALADSDASTKHPPRSRHWGLPERRARSTRRRSIRDPRLSDSPR